MGEHSTDVTSLMADELNSLSLQERNKAYESIHGVDDVIVETEGSISKRLEELEEAIGQIHVKPAYEQAKKKSNYVNSRSFGLMFLRASSFDPEDAAARMVCYLEEKLERFGPHTLNRGLTLKDLSPNTTRLLSEFGIHQILPVRDSAGRVIYLMHHCNDVREIVRQDPLAGSNLMFYIVSAIAEDEESQKRGMVSLQIVSDLPALEDLDSIQATVKRSNAEKWCPIRIKAIHYWLRPRINPIIRTMMEILTREFTKNAKTRTRLHTGSYVELKYKLLTFGVPADFLPYSTDGSELRLTAHSRWITRRRKRESKLRSKGEFHALDLPGCRDVCLGRGSASHQHAGNVYMRILMAPIVEEYRNAEAKQRQVLNKRLVQMVRDNGGRFLTKTSGGWYEEVAEEAEIEKRVGGSFRGLLSRTNRPSPCTDMEIEPRVDVKRPRLSSKEIHNIKPVEEVSSSMNVV